MNEGLLKDFCTFATKQITSWDIDPSYPVLKWAYQILGFEQEQALWRTFLYVVWYHVGSALEAWDRFPTPDAFVFSSQGCADLATGIERRGFRGNHDALYMHVNAFCSVSLRRFGSIREWIVQTIGDGDKAGWARMRAEFMTIPHAGPWASYKWCDLLKHVHSFRITANDIGVGGGSETSGPIPGMVMLTGESWKRCAGDHGLQQDLLNTCVARGVPFNGLDQLETALCDFNSLCKGRYYVGHDVDQQLEQLTKAGAASPRAEKALAPFWQARQMVFDPKYLGEIGGWAGVRKHLKGVYAWSGEIV